VVSERALRIDDDVAEALYSGNRRVPTYTKSQIYPAQEQLQPELLLILVIFRDGNLSLDGLDSGLSISLNIRNLMARFSVQDQITRLVLR